MGNVDAQTAIGQLFNLGSRGIQQDFTQVGRHGSHPPRARSFDYARATARSPRKLNHSLTL
jgi:hypothetical protein